ncbi:MAG: VOC family protein [Actinoallomurus sp.]
MFDPDRGYPSAVPYLRYVDPQQAVQWLTEVLHAREAVRMTLPDGRIGHAELTVGNAVISLGLAVEPGVPADEQVSRDTLRSMTLVFVDDVDHAVRRAISVGGTVIDEATDQPWGLRQAIVADSEGYLWELSVHLHDVPVETWGATEVGPLPG